MKLPPPLLAVALLASCVSTPRPSSDLEVPSRWRATGAPAKPLDSAGLARWWRRFDDAALHQLIDEALRSSPDARAALAKVDESRARRAVEKSALFPSLTGGASAQGARTDHHLTGISSSEGYGASVDMSWQVDLFGKLRQNLKAATADLAQAQENHHAVQVSLAAEVAEAYVDLRAAEAQLAVYQRNIAAREGTVRITQWREQAGEGSRFETQQARSTLDQARAALPTLRQTIGQTKNRLALLAGKTPGAVDALLAAPRRVPRPPAQLAAGIPAETLRQRPDVRAAEHALEAAAARTKAAEREQLPTLNLSGSIGVDALKAGHLFSPETAAAQALGSLAAPIFNAGRIRQTIHMQSAQERQALIQYEAAVLQALSEVENALIATQRTAERLGVLDSAVAAAQDAEKLASQSYLAGQVDLLQVLDAQRTLLSLEEQQTLARGDHASAHIQLYKALGGGWSR